MIFSIRKVVNLFEKAENVPSLAFFLPDSGSSETSPNLLISSPDHESGHHAQQ
jgi:hypothetical protein